MFYFIYFISASERATRATEAGERVPAKRKRTCDNFVYPEANGYAGIVSAVHGLPTPDKWRRELTSLHRGAFKGAPTHRLYMRELLFPGRCAICKRNNKSLSHCVIGQGAKNAPSAETLDTDTLLKASKFVFMAERMLADPAHGPPADAGVFVFVHETDIENPKKLHRISEQHGFPPIDPLLRQEPFSTYFSPEMFRPLFGSQMTIKAKNIHGVDWIEPESKFLARKKMFEAALTNPNGDARRGQAATAITECYTKLLNTHCTQECEEMYKHHKALVTVKFSCSACKVVRCALKKQHIDTMVKTVTAVVNKLFSERKPPFAGCPLNLTEDRYVDRFCRVERVKEAGNH